jgi:Fe-S cluster biogenesis protein NfuA
MANATEDKEFRKRAQRLETLLQAVEQFPDPAMRAHTRDIVQTILDLHGTALGKILEYVAEAGETGLALIDRLARDDLVGSLLLLYGLHPLDIETRVRQALESVRPSLRSHGGNVELLGVAEGVVRLRMEGSCHGCPSSAVTLKLTIEEAIYDKAPDVTAIEIDDATVEQAEAPSSAAVPGQPLPGMNGPGQVENSRARIALPILQR